VAQPTIKRAAGRLVEAVEYAAAMARLGRDLRPYVRTPLAREQAQARLRHNLANREQRLLSLVEQGIYCQPRSPYLKLLRHAGCELGDFRALIGQAGIEGGLKILADRGVYVTFEEMKGLRETVRGSGRFTFQPSDFDNPLVRPHLFMYTGGSGGRPTRVPYSLAFIEEWASSGVIVLEAHGVSEPRQVVWWPVPMAQILASARLGNPTLRWFYPVHPLPPMVRLAARYIALVGRLAGCRLPRPERCDLERPEPLAAWLAEQLRDGHPMVVWTLTGLGARLGLAATAAGLDLRGSTFMVAGEPVTDERRRQMEASGAQLVVVYGSIEISAPAYSCATPLVSDDLHAMVDRFVMFPRPRPAISGGPVVNALLVSSLSPAAPKLAFNAEMGDYGRFEERECGCLLGELGLRTHLSEIRSFEKLTGEGVTFARSNLEQILDRALPARFGGTGFDYQLAEEEAASGATRLVLRVSPTIGAVDEAAVRSVFLEELGRANVLDQYQAEIWRNAGTLEIHRERPLATRGGKVLPFRLLDETRRAAGSRSHTAGTVAVEQGISREITMHEHER
jgi:hypothetical protein